MTDPRKIEALTPTEAAARYIEILDSEGSKAAVAWFAPIKAAATVEWFGEMESEFIRLGWAVNDAHRQQFHCTSRS